MTSVTKMFLNHHILRRITEITTLKLFAWEYVRLIFKETIQWSSGLTKGFPFKRIHLVWWVKAEIDVPGEYTKGMQTEASGRVSTSYARLSRLGLLFCKLLLFWKVFHTTECFDPCWYKDLLWSTQSSSSVLTIIRRPGYVCKLSV